MPLGKNVRFRFKTLSSRKAVRLAFEGNKTVEVTPYVRQNGKWVKAHSRSHPRRN